MADTEIGRNDRSQSVKLFVWNDPYSVAYGGSCLYVVAETEEQARELAKTATVMRFGFSDGGALGDVKLGEPSRVLNVPCAEVFHHEE